MSVFFVVVVFYKALKPSAPDKGANNIIKNPMTNSNNTHVKIMFEFERF